LKLATSNLVYNLSLGSSLPRNNFYDHNRRGSGLGGLFKKFGTPYLFLQPLKQATSIWYTTWAWGVAYQETTFRTKIGRGPGYGSIQKIWDPLFISATVEASNFNLVYNLGMGSGLPKNNFQDQNWQGSGLWEHPKKLGHPIYFCNR